MNTSNRPQGYSTVSPYLVVDGAAQTINFLKTVFGAVELMRMTDENGVIQHTAVRIQEGVTMLADRTEDIPPTSLLEHIYVKDVDKTYQKAIDAGVVSVQEPQKKDDPDRCGGVKDKGGTVWWIANPVG